MKQVKIEKTLSRLGIKHVILPLEIRLSLTYKAKYDISEIKFDSSPQSFVLVKEKRKNSIENLVYQANYIANQVGMEYILVFNKLEPEEINYMLQWHIPFINYDGSLFLPFLTLFLNQPKLPEHINMKKFTPSQQLMMTYMLSLSPYDAVTIEQIQQVTELSQPTVYRGINLFTQLNWIEKVGQTIRVSSVDKLFESVKQYFFNPIKKIIYVEKENFRLLYAGGDGHRNFRLAGEKALSHKSMLAKTDSSEQYAISLKKFNEVHDELGIPPKNYSSIKSPDSVEIQLWEYQAYHELEETENPKKQSFIDPISLYLTLKDEEDSRIQKELEQMLKQDLGRGARDDCEL